MKTKRIVVSIVRTMEVTEEDFDFILSASDEGDMQAFLEMTELTDEGFMQVGVMGLENV